MSICRVHGAERNAPRPSRRGVHCAPLHAPYGATGTLAFQLPSPPVLPGARGAGRSLAPKKNILIISVAVFCSPIEEVAMGARRIRREQIQHDQKVSRRENGVLKV